MAQSESAFQIPVLSSREIVQRLYEFFPQEVSVSESDLRDVEIIKAIYQLFLRDILNIPVHLQDSNPRCYKDKFDDPQLFSNSLFFFHQRLQYLMKIAKVNTYTFADIMPGHDFHNAVRILSYLINYMIFVKDNKLTLDKMVKDAIVNKEKARVLESEIASLNTDIALEEESRKELLSEVTAVNDATRAVKTEIENLDAQEKQIANSIQSVQNAISSKENQTSELRADLASQKETIRVLESRIVDSPEAAEQELREKGVLYENMSSDYNKLWQRKLQLQALKATKTVMENQVKIVSESITEVDHIKAQIAQVQTQKQNATLELSKQQNLLDSRICDIDEINKRIMKQENTLTKKRVHNNQVVETAEEEKVQVESELAGLEEKFQTIISQNEQETKRHNRLFILTDEMKSEIEKIEVATTECRRSVDKFNVDLMIQIDAESKEVTEVLHNSS